MGGGFRYVQARTRGAGPAIATVTSDGSPICHAVVIAGRNVAVRNFPDDARGLSLAFTHVESTTGWLMVYSALVARGIEPGTYFRYSAGHQHADNVRAVARGDFDLATDSETNRRSMVERGLVDAADVRIVWRSKPLPQDPIAISNRLEPQLAARLQQALVAIDAHAAHTIPMPRGYTGFVAASDESYDSIREAAVLVGRIPVPAASRTQQVTT
jgi:phosphonate transport system substrate-binding protein